MRRLLNEIARAVPTAAYPILVPLADAYLPREVSAAASFLLGLAAARAFRAQHALGFLGFRLALFSGSLSSEPRLLATAFLAGSAAYLAFYYRGYAAYRLYANAAFAFASSGPILAAILLRRLPYRPSIAIAAAYSAVALSISVRRVRGTPIERLLAPFGASFGSALATYFAAVGTLKFRAVSLVLLGIVPLLIALALEIRLILALRELA